MPDPAPWRWFFNHTDPVARMLTFARGISVDTLIEGYGMNAAHAQVMTGAQAAERFPALTDFNEPPFHIRVAPCGGWVVAFEHNQLLDLLGPVPQVPPGTDLFAVRWTITTQASFSATLEGQWSAFDPITTPPPGADPNLLDTIAAPWLQLRESADFHPTLMATFADHFGIPPISIGIVSGPMLTAWRDQ